MGKMIPMVDEKEKSLFMFETIQNLYNLEWNRSREIQLKATNIITFNGVILAIILATLSNIYTSIPEKSICPISVILFFCIILSLFSIYKGIKTLELKDWSYLGAEGFYERNCNKNVCYLINSLSKSIEKNIISNERLNNKNANNLKLSYLMFYINLVLVILLFVYSLIAIEIWR